MKDPDLVSSVLKEIGPQLVDQVLHQATTQRTTTAKSDQTNLDGSTSSSDDPETTLDDVNLSLMNLEQEINILRGRLAILGVNDPKLELPNPKGLFRFPPLMLHVRPLLTAILLMMLWAGVASIFIPEHDLHRWAPSTIFLYTGLFAAFATYPYSITKMIIAAQDAKVILDAAMHVHQQLSESLEPTIHQPKKKRSPQTTMDQSASVHS